MASPLELARAKMKARRDAGEVIVRMDPIAKAHAKPSSLRAAVNGKCWDCMGAGADTGTRKAIGECPCHECCLWPVRPYQKDDGDEENA